MQEIIYALAFTIGWLLASAGFFLMVLTWPWTRYLFAALAVASVIVGEPLAGAGFGTVALLGGMALYYAGETK